MAPEHVSDNVLRYMGKPGQDVYRAFCDEFARINEGLGLKQFIVPYLMSSHPGSTLEDAVKLAEAVRDMGYMPEQVSDFYPTPSTLSTVMWYTGVDPRTMEPVFVEHSEEGRAMQRALIQYRDPKNYDLVRKALLKARRADLIGYGKRCLIPPEHPKAGDAPAGRGGRGAGPANDGGRKGDRSKNACGTGGRGGTGQDRGGRGTGGRQGGAGRPRPDARGGAKGGPGRGGR